MLFRSGLTDGIKLQTAWAGYTGMLDDYGLPTEPGDLSLFDALLPADATAALREILKSEQTFSEDIAAEIARLLGIPENLVLIGPEEKPYAELALIRIPQAKKDASSQNDTLPPKLYAWEYINREYEGLLLAPRGGSGKGLVVYFIATDYDPENWTLPVVTLIPGGLRPGSPEARRAMTQVQPERCSFSDGKKGWVARFPDAIIPAGRYTG